MENMLNTDISIQGDSAKILVVIPTYNERENIEPLASQILGLEEGFHLLFVDDNSPDGTGEIADNLAVKHNRVNVIHRAKKLGMGTAYIEGLKFAINGGFEYIIQMDADFSHHPKYLPVFLEKIKDHDVVLGSRYCNGISVVNWSFFRLILSLLACKYVQAITGLSFSDPLGGFKCYRRKVLEDINLDRMTSEGYIFQMEVLYKAFKKGFKICEIPIVFIDRGFGQSKMSRKIIFEAFYKVPLIRLGHFFSESLRRIKGFIK